MHALEVGHDEFFKLRMDSSALLYEGELVTETKAILKEQRATKALHGSVAHYVNTVTEHISFIHMVSREEDGSVFLVLLKHSLYVATHAEVHS